MTLRKKEVSKLNEICFLMHQAHEIQIMITVLLIVLQYYGQSGVWVLIPMISSTMLMTMYLKTYPAELKGILVEARQNFEWMCNSAIVPNLCQNAFFRK